jgi:hypothetical protein
MSDPPGLCTRCHQAPRPAGQRWCVACRNLAKRAARAARRERSPARPAFNPENGEQPGGRALGLADRVVHASSAPGRGGNGSHSASQAKRGVVGERRTPPQKEAPEPVAPPAPYLPYDGLEPDPAAPPRAPWYGTFLRDLAERGLMSLAAARAGVHISKVRRRRAADPAFAEEIEVARDYYKAYLEWQSVELGRVNRNPLPFFARLKAELPARYIDKATMLVASVTGELPAEDGRALLLAMFGQGTPPAIEGGDALPAHVVDGAPSGTGSD